MFEVAAGPSPALIAAAIRFGLHSKAKPPRD